MPSASVVVLVAPVTTLGSRDIVFLFDIGTHHNIILVQFLDGNSHYHNDDCEWEPRVLRFDSSCNGDGGDGNVGRYGDKHCADRLSFYLEFHPMDGLALVILIEYVEAIVNDYI